MRPCVCVLECVCVYICLEVWCGALVLTKLTSSTWEGWVTAGMGPLSLSPPLFSVSSVSSLSIISLSLQPNNLTLYLSLIFCFVSLSTTHNPNNPLSVSSLSLSLQPRNHLTLPSTQPRNRRTSLLTFSLTFHFTSHLPSLSLRLSLSFSDLKLSSHPPSSNLTPTNYLHFGHHHTSWLHPHLRFSPVILSMCGISN